MKTLKRLNNLLGKSATLSTRAGEFNFRFLTVRPADNLPTETDEEGFQNAVTASEFLVQFDQGTLIDGSNTMLISGRDISRIRGNY